MSEASPECHAFLELGLSLTHAFLSRDGGVPREGGELQQALKNK